MNRTQVTESELLHPIAVATQGLVGQLYPLDTHYWVASEADTLQAIRECHVDAMKYVSDIADCDKHSRLLYALLPDKFQLNSIGLVVDFSGKHSYNLIVVQGEKELEVRWIEPQTSREIKLHSKACYSLTSGLVLI